MTDCQNIFEISGNFHTDLVSPWIDEKEIVHMDVYTASSLGNYDVVKDFLNSDHENSINNKNPGGWAPLMYASYVGHENVVTLLLSKGRVDVDCRTDKWCSTSLMLAASCGNEGVVLSLLQNGANINAEDTRGYTALFYAIIQDHKNVAKILVDYGADLEKREKSHGLTPLLQAAMEGHGGIFNILLSTGRGNLTAKASNGLTARQLAYSNGHTAIVNLIDNVLKPCAKLRSDPGLFDYSSSPSSNTTWGYGSPGSAIKHGPKAFSKLIHQKPSNVPKEYEAAVYPNTSQFNNPTRPQLIPRQGDLYGGLLSPRIKPQSPTSDSQGSSFEDLFFANSGDTIKDCNSLNEGLLKLELQSNGLVSPPRSATIFSQAPDYKSVLDFLHNLNLDKYIYKFIEEEVDFETFLGLNNEDLIKIGNVPLGPRKKIINAITEWKKSQTKDQPTISSLQNELSEAKLHLQKTMLQIQQQDVHIEEARKKLLDEKRKSQQALLELQNITGEVSQTLPELEELSKILNRLCKKSVDGITREVFAKLANSIDKLMPILQGVAEVGKRNRTHKDSSNNQYG